MILFFVLSGMSSIGTVNKSTPEKTEMSILPTSGQRDRHSKGNTQRWKQQQTSSGGHSLWNFKNISE